MGHFDVGVHNPTENMKIKTFQKLEEDDIVAIQDALSANCMQSSTDIQKHFQDRGTNVSKSTIKRAIAAADWTHSKPRYCSMIRDVNKQKRVEFCKELISTNDSLENVVFTDECTVQLHGNRVTCYRPRHATAVHVPVPKHVLKVHVWGGISKRGATQILIFDGIMRKEFFVTEILEGTLKPFLVSHYPEGGRFQQDNDPKHTSRLAKQYLADNNINTITWPSESCDLNPIEMLWSEMKHFIGKRVPRTKEQLISTIFQFWSELTPLKCQKYIDHVYKVAPVCVLMNGFPTGDLPGQILREPSFGKNFAYFSEKLRDPNVHSRACLLLAKE
ncbi:hypothetical protein FSP39_013781 [Pinctada imbricata]|uniref:Tc1-like transposase DDE domain-containing protein n=1 Tax=Pinctada imbricata TaxID=66713 RepID=A0AA88YIH1_PINIB|nr:hypothetical protein FSP39_013781 [Pinctada imbricata]